MTSTGKGAVNKADLHVHTTASDGLLSAEEVVTLCERRGVGVVAIADHDTVAGLRQLLLALVGESRPAGRGISWSSSFFHRGVEIIPAVEINAELDQKEVHILGYFVPVDPDSEFAIFLDTLRRSRMDRVRAIVLRLEELGFPVELERVLSFAKGESIGRPHVGQAMVEKGYVSSVKEAFEKYLGIGKPAYVPRVRPTPVQAVKCIVHAGGVAVWAHPGTAACDYILEELIENGLDGLECLHPEHSPEDTRRYAALAGEYGLIATGGSDFHGPGSGEGGELGEWVVDYSVVTLLEKARLKRGQEVAES